LLPNLVRPVPALDERAADVAVADEPLDRGHLQGERHCIRRGLARVRNGHHDGVIRVDAHAASLDLLLREFLPESGPREIYTAFVERTGDVGEVDPLEKAVRRPAFLREALYRELTILDENHLARLERFDLPEAEVEQRNAFAGGGEER